MPLFSYEGQDATTRTVMCPICKALYTPTPAHQQLTLAPHIVLESAFMSMCHFCFRCRRAACPDCWDAIHGVCGACVKEARLPFRTQVEPLSNAMPPLSPQQQVGESIHAASVLVCIQHGQFYGEPVQPSTATPSHRMSRPVRVAAPGTQSGKDDRRPQGTIPLDHPSPVSTMAALPPRDRHGRVEGGADGWYVASKLIGPLRASVVLPRGDKESTEQPGKIGWIAEVLGALEQWATGALLVLLLTIITLIMIAEASPSANAQIIHFFQIDIRSEVAYLIHLIGQLRW